MGIPDNLLEGPQLFHAQSRVAACLPAAHHRICFGWKPYVISLKGGTLLMYEAWSNVWGGGIYVRMKKASYI